MTNVALTSVLGRRKLGEKYRFWFDYTVRIWYISSFSLCLSLSLSFSHTHTISFFYLPSRRSDLVLLQQRTCATTCVSLAYVYVYAATPLSQCTDVQAPSSTTAAGRHSHANVPSWQAAAVDIGHCFAFFSGRNGSGNSLPVRLVT